MCSFILGTGVAILEWNDVISLESHRIMPSSKPCDFFGSLISYGSMFI